MPGFTAPGDEGLSYGWADWLASQSRQEREPFEGQCRARRRIRPMAGCDELSGRGEQAESHQLSDGPAREARG